MPTLRRVCTLAPIGLLAAAALMAAACTKTQVAATRPKSADPRTVAEKLGFPRDAKLLMVHADDAGSWHAVNAAVIQGFESGLVTSASAMVPCPWFPEIAAYARSHPDADLGLHLTVTSERPTYRWGPVASPDRVRSLVDEQGFFHKALAGDAVKKISPAELESELRAQVARALALGLKPTHLDGHQGVLFANAALFAVLRRVAREHSVPIRLARERLPLYRQLGFDLDEDEIVIDRIVTIAPSVAPEGWPAFYANVLAHLTPGVTELVVHPGFADDELRAATADRASWGAEWRQRDFDAITSAHFRRQIEERGIKLVNWRMLARALPVRGLALK